MTLPEHVGQCLASCSWSLGRKLGSLASLLWEKRGSIRRRCRWCRDGRCRIEPHPLRRRLIRNVHASVRVLIPTRNLKKTDKETFLMINIKTRCTYLARWGYIRSGSSSRSWSPLVRLLASFAAAPWRLIGCRSIEFERRFFLNNRLLNWSLDLLRWEGRMLEEVRGWLVKRVRVMPQQPLNFLVTQRFTLDTNGSKPSPRQRCSRLVPFQHFPRRHTLFFV